MSRYDIEKFDPPPDPDLVCCICQCVLDKAVECPCRHVFCQGCIERWLTNRHTCPTCRKRTRKQDLKPVLPLVQNMLNRLLMICEYRDNGCLEKIMLEHFERHIKNCGYEMKTCRFSKCGVRILRMHLEDHENEQCEHRETACEGECGLMIPLSDRPTHNCVAALKAHIDEKNRMIEQLKVKLHELNNLSQSLNDQLVELRQQLNDRNHIFSSDSSDSSESDVTDFMSDDLSRDSFRDSWFDSAASNISADNADNASNNDTGQDNNNNAGNAEGSDVVEQVERTVVNSLFELSSRLERVRNQMRAVLNSRLVQDQNNLNDDVRIPSAAELDAIVNSNSNENNNASAPNTSENYNNGQNDDDRRNDNGQNGDNNHSDNDTRYYTEDENHSDDRYSYANDSRWSNLTEENRPANPAGSDVSDLNWISDSDTNHTPYNRSPNASTRSPEYERYTPFRNESRNYNNQYISEHVILSQPPDSPSDTTGSFSSIPSTSSMVNSPSREDDNEDSMHGSFLTATPATDNHSSPAHSNRSLFNTTDNNSRSSMSSSPRSPDSCRNDEVSDHHSTNISNSSPAHSLSSVTSASEGNSSKSEASHCSSDENYCSSFNSHDDKSDTSSKSSPRSHSSDFVDSETDDSRNVETALTGSKVENKKDCYETSHVDSSLDYEHGESHEESQNGDNVSETSNEGLSHHEDQAESNDIGDNHHQDNTSAVQENRVSRCEPDSTQSPSTIQQHQNFSSVVGLSASNPLLISTATESTDSDNSESMKYITKRVRRSDTCRSAENSADINQQEGVRNIVLNESTDPGSTVDSGFITGSSSPTDVVSQPSGNSKKSSSRKRKHTFSNFESDEHKKSKTSGDPTYNTSDQTCQSSKDTNTLSETVTNNSNINRYGFRKRGQDNDIISVSDCKKNKTSGVNSQHLNGQTNVHRSRTSPPRSRQSWRETSQHSRRNNRTSASRRNNQSCINNDNNGQSLNVKIDLSLINYSGRLGSESTSSAIPTATVVHSANISPIATASSAKREPGHTNSRQNISDNGIKSSTPKQDDASYRNNHRQRSSRSQRHESLCSTRNANNNTSPVRVANNTVNTSNRDFPNSWRDSSDSSSDNTWEPGSDCDEIDDSSTEGDDGFDTESSYEVQIPKSTAALLEEYASDESDESWKVGMN
ncbi:putative uncharacterized protein DDB_G0282133 [Mercenaria mercenaria]|uniref:putative uncharacterized protein DDB_G0282133 n=1 Tax=Mercenaria mercenaria TaxID=6596 RepID=UPI00234EF7FD|nr:putative uncharacterized protein DDB_G0282133 [Mercenaria mercenaria]